jgi:transcriptional regulator with GAF, ATPase, and Fis domain
MKANVLTVIMTGFGTVETAIEAMKKGAYDYILKPFKIEEVVHVVERGLDRQRLHAENIRLKEAVSLYKISELIANSLSLDTILDVILDAVLIEAQADVVTLMLKDPRSGLFVERSRKLSPMADGGFTGELNLSELLDHYSQDRPLLAHGLKALRFFAEPPKDKRLVSFCSIPLKVSDRVIGMLNAYS